MKIPTNKDVAFSPENNSKDEIPSAVPDFSEYMWMENEEEFDEEVMKQLEEEALMEQCIEAMLEDELETQDNIIKGLEMMKLEDKINLAKKSTLNPNAAEFVPRSSVIEVPVITKEGSLKDSSSRETSNKRDLPSEEKS